jgi:hypothetical protein
MSYFPYWTSHASMWHSMLFCAIAQSFYKEEHTFTSSCFVVPKKKTYLCFAARSKIRTWHQVGATTTNHHELNSNQFLSENYLFIMRLFPSILLHHLSFFFINKNLHQHLINPATKSCRHLVRIYLDPMKFNGGGVFSILHESKVLHKK